MSFLKAKNFGFMAASVAMLTLVAAQGCGSDETTQDMPSAGSGGRSSAGAGGKISGAGAAGKLTNGGSGNGDAGSDNPGMGGDDSMGGEGPGMDCDGEDGCYKCAPTTNTQFLNHCVEGGCPASFDNSTLTKLNQVGTL